MVQSMTGYGRGEAASGNRRVLAEAKSVNHRFSDIVVRLSRDLSGLEECARRTVQSHVTRGRVDLYLTLETVEGGPGRLKVDKELAMDYYNCLRELQEALGADGDIEVVEVAKFPEVLALEDEEADPEEMAGIVARAVEQAMVALVAMRAREGGALAADLSARLDRVDELCGCIDERSPQVVVEYRDRLRTRLQELLPSGVVDEDRLAMEVAILADRASITEELVRLGSHVAQIREALAADGAIGRKLEFILQEMYREINTISSKAGDAEIARHATEIKGELEKMREQAQNIE